MGITPDITIRERKHSVKSVGLTVVACLRMRKMMEGWAGNKRLQESLLKKLEGVRGERRSGKV